MSWLQKSVTCSKVVCRSGITWSRLLALKQRLASSQWSVSCRHLKQLTGERTSTIDNSQDQRKHQHKQTQEWKRGGSYSKFDRNIESAKNESYKGKNKNYSQGKGR